MRETRWNVLEEIAEAAESFRQVDGGRGVYDASAYRSASRKLDDALARLRECGDDETVMIDGGDVDAKQIFLGNMNAAGVTVGRPMPVAEVFRRRLPVP